MSIKKTDDIQGYNIPQEMVQEWADSFKDDKNTRRIICPTCGEILAIVTGAVKSLQAVCPYCGASTLIDVNEDGSTKSSTLTKEQYAEYLRRKNKQQ